jgi:predicted ester cyclase
MSIEENKVLVRRFCELVNKRDVDGIRGIMASEFVAHRTTYDIYRDDWEEETMMLFNTYPDLTNTQEHIIAEGDKVAWRETYRGTHARMGKKVEWINTYIVRIADGKWAEAWGTIDSLNLMQQLDVVPE